MTPTRVAVVIAIITTLSMTAGCAKREDTFGYAPSVAEWDYLWELEDNGVVALDVLPNGRVGMDGLYPIHEGRDTCKEIALNPTPMFDTKLSMEVAALHEEGKDVVAELTTRSAIIKAATRHICPDLRVVGNQWFDEYTGKAAEWANPYGG